MSTAGLAPAGSSTYNSATMYVGDGTWDAQRNTFLLPNLVGLNFATMRYNGETQCIHSLRAYILILLGMGNRFLEQPGYHGLIRAHGIIAAITFLAIVPASIMIKRFYRRSEPLSTRYHIWLQTLTVLLTTAIFVIGYLAVGPARSFTNPHHGIGLAVYVMVLVQFIGGWWVHSREKRKKNLYVPLRGVVSRGRFLSRMDLPNSHVVSSLAGPYNRTSWPRTDTTWVDFVRISKSIICTLFVGSICACGDLFRT